MNKQIKKLEAFFKRKVVSQDEDNGDDNSFGEYYKFINPIDVEY
jgi:hypothetical protein